RCARFRAESGEFVFASDRQEFERLTDGHNASSAASRYAGGTARAEVLFPARRNAANSVHVYLRLRDAAPGDRARELRKPAITWNSRAEHDTFRHAVGGASARRRIRMD